MRWDKGFFNGSVDPDPNDRWWWTLGGWWGWWPMFFLMLPMFFFEIFWCGFPCFLLPVLSVVLSTFSWFDPFQSSTFPRLVPSPATSNYLFPAVGSSMFFPYFFWMLHHFISFPFINMSKIISSNFQLLDILKMLPFFQSGITCGKTQTHVAKKKAYIQLPNRLFRW